MAKMLTDAEGGSGACDPIAGKPMAEAPMVAPRSKPTRKKSLKRGNPFARSPKGRR